MEGGGPVGSESGSGKSSWGRFNWAATVASLAMLPKEALKFLSCSSDGIRF
jgi:hypothetical protein